MSARGKWARPSLATRFSASYSIDLVSGCWDWTNKKRGTIGDRNRHAKLTFAQVKEIRNDTTTSAADLATRFGVCPKTIRNCRSGHTWSKA